LQYLRLEDTMFLFKCYQYDTDRGIRIDCHHGLVKKKEVDFTTSMMFLFLQNNIKQMYYIYTFFSLEMIITELIGYLL